MGFSGLGKAGGGVGLSGLGGAGGLKSRTTEWLSGSALGCFRM